MVGLSPLCGVVARNPERHAELVLTSPVSGNGRHVPNAARTDSASVRANGLPVLVTSELRKAGRTRPAPTPPTGLRSLPPSLDLGQVGLPWRRYPS